MDTPLSSAPATAPAVPAKPDEGRRAAIAGAVGTVIEYYDFALYGAASALVIGPLFFPTFSASAGVIASFATFAVGFFARPIGAITVAHFGDRIGRKPGLLFSIALMGVATVGVGLLPTYETAGVLAPILLVFLRFCQGLGAGAELAGALTYVVEHTRTNRPAFHSSLAASGVSLGLSLATLTFLVVSMMPREQLLGGGWRIPFIASALIFVVAAYIRSRVSESPDFIEEKKANEGKPVKPPLVEVFRERPVHLAVGILSLVCLFSFSYVGNTFMLSYLKNTVGMSGTTALAAGLTSTLLACVAAPFFGILGDRLGALPVLAGGTAFVAITTFPFFALVHTNITVLVVVSLALWYAIGFGSMAAVHGIFMARLFETRYRYTGIAVTREMPSALVGGTAPLVATALVATAGGTPWLVAGYVTALGVISLVTLLVTSAIAKRKSFFVNL